MNTSIEDYINSKAPNERLKSDLLNFLPWFKIYSKGVLRNVPDENIIEILRNCYLKYYQKDELIIMQGDIGSEFYIVINGEIHVYVNDSYEPFVEREEMNKPIITNKDDISMFGRCVAIEESGYSFGEFALHDENNIRKASVVAVKETLLLVINREKYNQNIKDFHQKEINERHEFIKKNPLFSDWNPRIRSMLMMSLKKLNFSYYSDIVIQGDEWKGLIFITKGSGCLLIDSDKHENQFPQFFPLDFDIYDKRYQEFPELKPPPVMMDLTEAESVEVLMPKHIRLKRAGKYVALEERLLNRKNMVCAVQSGEIIGDLEYLFNLNNNLQSVTSMEETEAFFLDLISIERILKRINSKTFNEKLKQLIKTKLNYRERFFRTSPVPLLLFLKYNLYDIRIENIRPLPKLKTEKFLPDKALEWQHLLKMFQENKASLCKPFVRGGIFLKDLMEKNKFLRNNSKEKKSDSYETIEMKNTANFDINRFPIPQERIYRFKNLTSDSIRFLELIYNDLRTFKKRDPRLENSIHFSEVKDTFEKKFEDIEEQIVVQNDDSSSTNTSKPFSRKVSKNFSFNNKYETWVQNSEVNFLNSLCSEKSRYEIKTDDSPRTTKDDKKIHFLPILKSHDKISDKIIPLRGAKVLVKRRRCIALDSNYDLKDHVHEQIQIVHKLDCENVEKLKIDVPEFLRVEYKKDMDN